MWYGISAALAFSIAIVHYKWILRETKIELRTLLPLQFILLFLFSSLLVPFFGRIDSEFFSLRYLILFGIMVVVAAVYNLFWTSAFRRQSLHDFELIDLLVPVFTILLAALVFFDEREPIKLALALFAAGAFFVTHIRRHHINFKQADRWFLFAIFLIAAEVILAKPLLTLLSPVSLYALRTGIIAVFFVFLFRPRFDRIHSFVITQMIVNSLFFVAYRVLRLASVETVGIVTTEMLLLTAPIFLTIGSSFVMKERWNLRNGLAFIIIMVTIFLMNLLSL